MMAIFNLFSSETDKFKHKFTKTYNLMINYSFGHLSVKDDVAIKQIEAGYLELVDMAKNMSNLFDNYFNFYLTASPTKISIGCALLMLTNAAEFVQNREPISKKALDNILLYAQRDITTEKGKWFVKELLETR